MCLFNGKERAFVALIWSKMSINFRESLLECMGHGRATLCGKLPE